DLGQPAPGCAGGAALEPGGTAIADDAADRRTEVVAADRELVRTEIIIARACNRASADIAVPSRAGGVGEIDYAAGRGDELRVAAGAVVVELRDRPVVRGDGCVAGGSGLFEHEHDPLAGYLDGVAVAAGRVVVHVVVGCY